MGPHEAVDANVRELSDSGQEDLIGHDPQDLAFLHPEPGDIILNNPKPPTRLEGFSVICIICNRMIGELLSHPTFLFCSLRSTVPLRQSRCPAT